MNFIIGVAALFASYCMLKITITYITFFIWVLKLL
jgi:hypothetical protein